MRILLLNVPWVEGKGVYGVKAGARWPSRRSKKKHMAYFPFPFSLAYATSVLKSRGFEARLRDGIAEEADRGELLRWTAEWGPELVVIETATPALRKDIEFARRLKEALPCKVAFCGPHCTALPRDVLSEEPVDFVLVGEYEYTLAELCESLKRDGGVQNLNGLCFKDNGRLVLSEPRELIADLDELPYPERDDVPILKYNAPFCKGFPNICMLTSRGCPYTCLYCVEPRLLFGMKAYRKRRPECVVDEMEYVLERYRPNEIFFDDSSSTIDQKRMLAICQEIRSRGLEVKWSCMGDVKASLETLRGMKEAGCVGVFVGVESGSPQILRRIRKPISLEEVSEFFENARVLGLYTHASFMFGLPGENRSTLRQTIEFAFSLPADTLQFSIATPFPGTEFYELARRSGWLITEEWSEYDGAGNPVIEYPECGREDIVRAMEEVRRRRMWSIIVRPHLLLKYLHKTWRMEGFLGLLREVGAKVSYLLNDRF